MINGVLIVNKPQGLTSHDVVAAIRRKFGIRRVGHAGTLDPLATGVLVLLIGTTTKLFNKFQSLDKAYRATLQLGTATHTADIHGKILCERPYAHITKDQLARVIEEFVGEIEQIPPMVSAVKVGGKRLYKLARQGIEVKRRPRKVTINALRLLHFEAPHVEFYLECSKGTYVRQLAHDIGERLGCGACITQIERIKVGTFGIEDAVNLAEVKENDVRPPEE
jgi:tRNA pseudouridine55 synthase